MCCISFMLCLPPFAQLALQLGHGESTQLLTLDGFLTKSLARVGLAERRCGEFADGTTLVAVELLAGTFRELLEVASALHIVVLHHEIMEVP